MIGRESEFTVKATADWKDIKLNWRFHNVSKKAVSPFDRVEMTLKVSECCPLTDGSHGNGRHGSRSRLLLMPEILLARILFESSFHMRLELILNFSRLTDGIIVFITFYQILNVNIILWRFLKLP